MLVVPRQEIGASYRPNASGMALSPCRIAVLKAQIDGRGAAAVETRCVCYGQVLMLPYSVADVIGML